MLRIHIVSDGLTGTRVYTLFPLIRWRRQLRDDGLDVTILSGLSGSALECDVLIVCSKYFRGWQSLRTRSSLNAEQVRDTLAALRSPRRTLVWFDTSDPGGSTDFGIVDLVDLFLKKQLYRNRTMYGSAEPESVRPWLTPEEANAHRTGAETAYHPCPADQLHKLRVAWNIGLGDYRYVCRGFAHVSHWTPSFPPLRFTDPAASRSIDLSFRGTVAYSTGNGIGAHRRRLVEAMAPLRRTMYRVEVSGCIRKRQYLRELRSSKLAVSPFGWGELCFRDFEAVMSGAALVKPAVEHLDTWPPFFEPDVTYVPLDWDLSNGREAVEGLLAHPERGVRIATAAQSRLRDHHASGERSAAAFASQLRQALTAAA